MDSVHGLGLDLGGLELSTVTRLRPPGVWGLCWAQGPGRELTALGIWRWCSFGCWFSFGLSATGIGVRDQLLHGGNMAGGHDHDSSNGRVCQGRSCHPAMCVVPPLSHPPLVSSELKLWDPFNTVFQERVGKQWCNGLELSMGWERWDSHTKSGITDGSFKKFGGHWYGELSAGTPTLHATMSFVSVCSLLKPSRCQSASAPKITTCCSHSSARCSPLKWAAAGVVHIQHRL